MLLVGRLRLLEHQTVDEVHQELLRRIIAWQEVLYSAPELPGWLADSLINILYMIPEDSMWAQATPVVGMWCRPEDGHFAMNESPRSCPGVDTLPNSACGNLPLTYFFPDSDLSALAAAARADAEPSSWSGSSRPSTSSPAEGRVQDVDARHEGEHDGAGLPVRAKENCSACRRNGSRPSPCRAARSLQWPSDHRPL